jgi:hypothetical protein
MKRFAVILLLVACRESAPDLHRPLPRGIDEPGSEYPITARPPFSSTPAETAREVAPNLFVSVLTEAAPGAASLETDREFLFIETMYDADGREFATSVPSTRWSLLGAESRKTFAGMKSGELRRIWRCKDGPSKPCTMEDVQIFDLAASRRGNNAAPKR